MLPPFDTLTTIFSFLSNDHLCNVVLVSKEFFDAGNQYIEPENYSSDMDEVPDYFERIAENYSFYKNVMSDDFIIRAFEMYPYRDNYAVDCVASADSPLSTNLLRYFADETYIISYMTDNMYNHWCDEPYMSRIPLHVWTSLIRASTVELESISPHCNFSKYRCLADPDPLEFFEFVVVCYAYGIIDINDTLRQLGGIIPYAEFFAERYAMYLMYAVSNAYEGNDEHYSYLSEVDECVCVDAIFTSKQIIALLRDIDTTAVSHANIDLPAEALAILDASIHHRPQ